MKNCINCGSELSDYATVCGVCGTAVSQDTVNVDAQPSQPFAPSYDYAMPTSAPKKNKKLLFGLIGGGAGLMVLLLVLCLVLCSGSIKFGMEFEDSMSAMESNGFYCLNQSSHATYSYSNYVGEIAEFDDKNAEVSMYFNENYLLDTLYITTECNVDTVKTFFEDELSLNFDKYDDEDYYMDDTRYDVPTRTFVGRNGSYIVIIREKCHYEKKDGKYTYVKICSLENMHKSDLDSVEKEIKSIRENEDYYY